MPGVSEPHLIYGFGPYGRWTHNITADIVGRLAEAGYTTHIFDVSFDAAQFLSVLDSVQPRRVLGLGQHPRARKLRIERRAVNSAGTRESGYRPIHPEGPDYRFMTLPLPQTPLTTVTHDAGRYVCNFSMYLVADWVARHGGRSGFLHVPLSADIGAVADYVRRALFGR